MSRILVTGSGGFIGFHLVNRLIEEGHDVVGIDNINDYYAQSLKYDRLREAGIDPDRIEWNTPVIGTKSPGYTFIRMDLTDHEAVESLFHSERFDVVIHLAAQAGVRYSLKNPRAYVESNITGFFNVLECCRMHDIGHFVYASSSSVYGNNSKVPFSEGDNVDHPISIYAATKKSNELMAHTYSHLYGLPTTGLRFFTVYGPWGRPDMAYYAFADAITEGKPIKLFNHGKLWRDFTYIDDIVEGVVKVIDAPMDNREGEAPYRVLNIGNHTPVLLTEFIGTLERALGKEAKKEFIGMQPGDVERTFADVGKLEGLVGFRPATSLTDGLESFVEWYVEYMK